MTNRLLPFYIAIVGILIVCSPMLAHHGSAASYDLTKQVTMTGTVTEWFWENPHCYVMYNVKDDKGNVVLWGAETHPPNIMTDRGWTRHSLKPGDSVTITLFPSKTGQPRGLLAKVVFNGKVLLDDTSRGKQELSN